MHIQTLRVVILVKVGVMRHAVRKVSPGAIGFRSAIRFITGAVVNIRLYVMMGIIKVQMVYAASYVGLGLQHCVLEPDW